MLSAKSSESYWLEFSRNAMACPFEVLLLPESAQVRPGFSVTGPEAACEALDLISYLEQLLSVYIPTSDLSRLNARGAETDVEIARPVLEMLKLGLEIFRETSGAFDMTAAQLSQVWGFASRKGRMPSSSEIEQAMKSVGSQHILLNEERSEARFERPTQINPGGIGKGYAIDCAAQLLNDRGVTDFAIHGGKSSIRCHGSQRLELPLEKVATGAERGWRVAVRHPEQTERVLGTLNLVDCALGTSGPSNQFFYFRGTRYGHIIDPRTGWPARGMLSITVLHPSAAWADALATGLYVMGLEGALEYAARRPETGILAIVPGKRDGEIEVICCNLAEAVWQPSHSD